jgi:hypothetical protein
MFTWICQKCGSEVPPSEIDCPNCRAKAAAASSPAIPMAEQIPIVTPRAVAPSSSTTQPVMPPPQPVQRKAHSPMLVAVGSAIGILAILAILYLYILPRNSSKSSVTTLENPGGPGTSVPAHPLAKYLEITGVRVVESAKGQAKIGYVVVNHSPADLPELQAHITLNAAGKQMFDFAATIPSIGPYESKDLTTSIKTQLQPYELPDWQVVKPVVRITSER